jgi:hypothetical protein
METDLRGANLTGATVYGVSAWNVKLEGSTQNDLVITTPLEPQLTVDDLDLAQFIYLLLNRQTLRSTINAVTQRGVLLLGRFRDGGSLVLHSLVLNSGNAVISRLCLILTVLTAGT